MPIPEHKVLLAFIEAGRIREKEVAQGQTAHTWPDKLLQEWTGRDPALCAAAMERVVQQGLVEYVFTLRTGWLTPLGIQRLDTLNAGAPPRAV